MENLTHAEDPRFSVIYLHLSPYSIVMPAQIRERAYIVTVFFSKKFIGQKNLLKGL